MRISVIGAGNVGGALGRLWAAQGHDIIFGVPDPASAKTQALVQSIGRHARAESVADAAASAEVIVLAVPWPAAEQALRAAGNLADKTLIDCTNPLTADISGLTLGTSDSAGEQVARWAQGAKVVKAFNTIGAGSFSNPRFGSERASMLIAGDDGAAKTTVGHLATELGFDVVDAGPLRAARWLEAVGMLWIHLAFAQGWGPAGHAFKILRR